MSPSRNQLAAYLLYKTPRVREAEPRPVEVSLDQPVDLTELPEQLIMLARGNAGPGIDQ